MRRALLVLTLSLLLWPWAAFAQPAEPDPDADADADAEADADADAEAEAAVEEETETRLRAPSFEPIEVPDDLDGDGDDDDLPSPDEASDELHAGGPGEGDSSEWSAPQLSLTWHGYFRVRGELQDTFWLGRRAIPPGMTDPPFDRFRPIENGVVPPGGCGDSGEVTARTGCDTESLGFANMRLRLEPVLAISPDVRVHFMIDIFDNMVLGTAPDGFVVRPGPSGYERVERPPRVPLDSFTATSVPPQSGRNSLRDSIAARRAWAEVTNRGLGQLRFGRMGSDWGLGILANGGEGIDSDFQSDVDRVMVITKLAGFHLIAAYDFASQGFIRENIDDPLALAYDAGQDDDVNQYVFAVARRLDEETQQEALQRGDWVLNYGAYFVYRTQTLTTQGLADPFGSSAATVSASLVRRGAEAFIPDLWGQFLYRGLRIEAEAVLIAGSIENTANDSFSLEDYSIMQLGAVLEAEYRLLDDKLGLHFNTGFATGDADVEGLTVTAGLPVQHGGDRTISTFRFHPNYRIDLILWRNIMQQIAGAYYFKPGISYDIIRNSFGQLFGLRADLIYSRASSPVQTWGNDADLGVEINASLYYRSEDGPDMLDGFFAMVQYGLLIPMKGLGYLQNPDGSGQFPGGGPNPELKNAQTLRLVLGVQY